MQFLHGPCRCSLGCSRDFTNCRGCVWFKCTGLLPNACFSVLQGRLRSPLGRPTTATPDLRATHPGSSTSEAVQGGYAADSNVGGRTPSDTSSAGGPTPPALQPAAAIVSTEARAGMMRRATAPAAAHRNAVQEHAPSTGHLRGREVVRTCTGADVVVQNVMSTCHFPSMRWRGLCRARSGGSPRRPGGRWRPSSAAGTPRPRSRGLPRRAARPCPASSQPSSRAVMIRRIQPGRCLPGDCTPASLPAQLRPPVLFVRVHATVPPQSKQGNAHALKALRVGFRVCAVRCANCNNLRGYLAFLVYQLDHGPYTPSGRGHVTHP